MEERQVLIGSAGDQREKWMGPGSRLCGRERREAWGGDPVPLGALVLGIRDHRRSKGLVSGMHLQGRGDPGGNWLCGLESELPE